MKIGKKHRCTGNHRSGISSVMKKLMGWAILKTIFLVTALLLTGAVYAGKGDEPPRKEKPKESPSQEIIAHSWVSKKIQGAIWGIAFGDVDGDGSPEIISLERDAVHVGVIRDDKYQVTFTYEWRGLEEGVRLYTIDLDGNGTEEVIVSAVDRGRPSSFALTLSDKILKPFFEHQPWHLRVLDKPAGKVLIGQQWNTTDFFAGPIYELAFNGKKLKHAQRLILPRRTELFDFAFLPISPDDEDSVTERVIRIEGNEPMKVYERKGKRFKKEWSSGLRYDGSANIIDAHEREPLSIAEDEIAIDLEPEVIQMGEKSIILATRHDVPLMGIIGRRPLVHNGRIVALQEEPSLGFVHAFETEEVPGYISDFIIKSKRLVASVQVHPSMFYESAESILLFFDMPDVSVDFSPKKE